MTIRAYSRIDLALSQLEAALCLFANGKDFPSAITLAGAADEVFGKVLASRGLESSLESIKKAVAAIHLKLYGEETSPQQIVARANGARNALKHWNDGDSELVKLDLEVEARDMLHRAIDNYWAVEEKLSPAMESFQRANADA